MSIINVKVDRNGHQNRLNNALKKLLTNSPDITIVAEDEKIEVDRLLLLMYSPTLRSAISEQNSSSSSSLLFPDYSMKSVRALLDLLVSGFSSSTNLTAKDFESVLEIAKDLQIQIDGENVEMVESKVGTKLVNMVTKSMNIFETKSLNHFKIQDCATLPSDSISKLNFPDSVKGNNCGDLGNEIDVKVEVVEEYGEKSVYLVRCKESWGEFHHDKFDSGSKGHCIFFKEKWMTPNDFERLAGSKGKKYKETLHVNGKPLKLLIDPNGTKIATPSVKQRQFSDKSKIDGDMSILGTPLKGKGGQGSISHYFTTKLKNQETNLNQDEASPSRGDVNLKDDMKGKSRIAEIADSNKRKRQSNEPNVTRITKSQKMELDIMPEVNVKHALMSEGENLKDSNDDKDDFFSISDAFPSDDESCTENPLIMDLKYADNCQSPIVSQSNAKLIINNVFQELMDSVQFEQESIHRKASVGTSNGNLDDKFLKPVTKRVNRVHFAPVYPTRYSVEQKSGLCKAFDENNYLSKEKAQELSKELCLTENQVRTWFKKSRAKTKAVTIKHDDKVKVKTEIVDDIEHHLKEMIDEDNEMKSADEEVHKIQNEIESLFEAYSILENQCTCECGVTFKNAKLLNFHKHICRKSSESNAAAKEAIMDFKEDGASMDIDKDHTVITRNGFPSDGVKNQCTCECGGSFKNAIMLKFHKHACPTKVTKVGL